MSDTAKATAEKIMDLVDEFPSGPLSFERRGIIDQITCLITKHTQEDEDALDVAFETGVEEGRSQERDELDSVIQDLEDEVSDLKEQVEEAYQKGYDDGFDTASASSS